MKTFLLLILMMCTCFQIHAQPSNIGNQPKSGPVITSVTPLLPQNIQSIIIRGSGFGSSSPQTRNLGDSIDTVDSGTGSSLVIRDHGKGANGWAAGRITAGNLDAIGIKLVSWSDSEIVLNGFGSALGRRWKIAAGDPIEVVVFGPAHSGSATFNTVVVGSSSQPSQNAGQSVLQVVKAPTVSTTPWNWNLRFAKPTMPTATTSHTITESAPTLPPQTTLSYSNVNGGSPVPVLGWPFTISIQVSNSSPADLQPPSLIGLGGKDALDRAAQFTVTPQNPPAKIAAGQTVTLTFSVEATWNTFKPPNAVALSPDERTTSGIAQQILGELKDITKYQSSVDSTAKELPDLSLFLTAVNDVTTGSQLISGAKAVMAEEYSFHLQTTNEYSISDQFSNSDSENVWVLWQPYKTDVVTAYYIGIFTDLVPGIGDMDTVIAECAAPQNIAMIMGCEDVMNNLSWYQNALEGDISFSGRLLSSP